MSPLMCLVAAALVTGQGASRESWKLSPQLSGGQELAWSGSFEEESLTTGVRFKTKYRLNVRAVVVETTRQDWEAVVISSLLRNNGRLDGKLRPPSVRMERLRIDKQGKILSIDRQSRLPLLDGPPTNVRGVFVATPDDRIRSGDRWAVMEPGRPPLTWRLDGTIVLGGARCIKMVGTQQTADWSNPRADKAAWRRVETLCVHPRTGVVEQIERIVEHRPAAHVSPTKRFRLRLRLEKNVVHPSRIFRGLQQESVACCEFFEQSAGMLLQPNRNKRNLDGLFDRIRRFESDLPKDAHSRLALEQLRQRIRAVQRGDLVIARPPIAPVRVSKATLGQRAPDFLANDLIKGKSVQLYKMLGRPILMVFYHPENVSSQRMLKLAKELNRLHKGRINIVCLTMSRNLVAVRAKHKEMGLTFPALDGTGLKRMFGVDATPRVILLDERGIVRLAQTGWGIQVPAAVRHEVQRLLTQKRP